MSFILNKWKKYGRVLINDSNPNQQRWISKLGESNLDMGNGTFTPYHWDENNATLKHGDNAQCEFTGTHQIIKGLGRTLVSRSRIFLQRETSPGVWSNIDHGGNPTRNIQHDTPEPYMCRAWLDFVNIQGYGQGARFQCGIEAGRSNKQRLGFRMVSPIVGTFRIEWVLDIPDNVPLSWIDVPKSYQDIVDETGETVRIGGRIGDFEIRWSRDEAPYRNVTIEDDGQGGRVARIFLGPYNLEAGVSYLIYPDTWGPTGIVADVDDGYEYLTDWYSTDPYYVRWGLQWDVTVGAGATFDNGCNIRQYHAAGDYSGNPTGNIYGWDADNPPDFSNSNLPSTRPQTTASVLYTPSNPGTPGWKTTDELKTIVQELFDSYGPWSGETIAFFVPTHSGGYMDFEDYASAGSNESELTLTYTTAAVSADIIAQTINYNGLGRMDFQAGRV